MRKKPGYLRDYVLDDESDDQVLTNVDYYYRVTCDVPLTFRDAVTSHNSKE